MKGVAVKPLHLFTLAQTLCLVVLYVLTRLKDVSVVFPFFIGMHAMQQQSAAQPAPRSSGSSWHKQQAALCFVRTGQFCVQTCVYGWKCVHRHEPSWCRGMCTHLSTHMSLHLCK